MSIALDHTTPTTRSWPDAGAYTHATEEMARMHRQFLVRTAAQSRRRHLVRMLDVAIDQCELRNLAARDEMLGRADLRAPQQAAALIVRLQRELYGESRPPQSNQEALDTLFGLQRAFMPYCDDDDREEASR